jgi:hypothetical protein
VSYLSISLPVPGTEYLHLACLSRYYMLTPLRLSLTSSFAAFERYNISKHHGRSLSGPKSQYQGHCRSAHHGFTTSISISIRGVFRVSYLLFWESSKSGPCHRLRKDMDHGLTASPTTSPSHLFLVPCTEILHVASLLCHCRQ